MCLQLLLILILILILHFFFCSYFCFCFLFGYFFLNVVSVTWVKKVGFRMSSTMPLCEMLVSTSMLGLSGTGRSVPAV